MRRVLTFALLSLGAGVLGCQVKVGDETQGDGGEGGETTASGGRGGSGGSSPGDTGGRAGDANTGGRSSAGSSAVGGEGGRDGEGEGGEGGGASSDAVDDILKDPAVQSALEEARRQGVDIVTHTEKDAPDPTGYYAFALRAGVFIASGNGANVGFVTAAEEMRVVMNDDGSVDTASVGSFDGTTRDSYGFATGYLLRGSGNEATLYGRRNFMCQLSGANYSLSGAFIWTGTFDADTGDWVDQRQFSVTTATEGELTSECATALVGNTEVVGGWAVAAIGIATKVTADDLVLMCVDGDGGYLPTESWTSADGGACECTTDFAVSCES